MTTNQNDGQAQKTSDESQWKRDAVQASIKAMLRRNPSGRVPTHYLNPNYRPTTLN